MVKSVTDARVKELKPLPVQKKDKETNKTLEHIVVGTLTSPSPDVLSETPEDLRLKYFTQFVNDFTDQYKREETFRDMVHSYLDLGVFTKMGLGLGKRGLFKNWYDKKTDEIITTYATVVAENIVAKEEYDALEAASARLQEELEEQKQEVDASRAQRDLAEREKEEAEASKLKAIEELKQKFRGQEKDLEEEVAQAKAEVKRNTDARAIAKDALRKQILKTKIVKKKESGYAFDDSELTKALEETFLKEIIRGIESEDGKKGFMTTFKESFRDTIDYWDVKDDYDLDDVDWHETIMNTLTRGRRIPLMPGDFVGPVYGDSMRDQKKNATIDTILMIDRSGSMKHNGRWEAAKQTGGATSALMRRLNPNNKTDLAVYNNHTARVTSKQLMLEIFPDGGTATTDALLEMIEIYKSNGEKPTIAYLVTDGAPNRYKHAIKAAGRFKMYENLHLRIILIDGDEVAKEIVEEMGKAAGRGTKYMLIEGYQLAGGLIRDLHKSVREMRDI